MEIKKKVIWLVCANVQPPDIDTHLRHLKFAEFLHNDGYDVYIIGGSYLHYNERNLIEKNNEKFVFQDYGNKKYYFINVPSYRGNGLKRIYSIFSFGFRLYRWRKLLPRPDIVVHNTRNPFDALIYFATKKLGAKYMSEVWDLWPYALEVTGQISKNNIFLRIAYKIEEFIYKKSERIIFTMEGGPDYIKDKGWSTEQGGKVDLTKCVYINNGIDLQAFNKNKLSYILDDKSLEDDKRFKVVYLGSIRLVNNVKALIEAAKCIQNEKDIVFYIYGNGVERESLEEYCKDNKLTNVVFKEKWVDIKYIPYILSHSSLNVLNNLYVPDQKYGISQGKLFQYLASGKPIISNNLIGYDIINAYGAGISENIYSPEQYAKLILSIKYASSSEYENMCQAALKAANDFDYTNLYLKYIKVLKSVLD